VIENLCLDRLRVIYPGERVLRLDRIEAVDLSAVNRL
jgi:hypothetical protein